MELELTTTTMKALLEATRHLQRLLLEEQEAFRSWDLSRLEGLVVEKELTLETVRQLDQQVRAELRSSAQSLKTSPAGLFEHPAGAGLRALRDPLRQARDELMRALDRSRRMAGHLNTFLERLHVWPPDPPLCYGPGRAEAAGRILHQVV